MLERTVAYLTLDCGGGAAILLMTWSKASQSRHRLRARVDRHPGAAARYHGVPGFFTETRLCLLG